MPSVEKDGDRFRVTHPSGYVEYYTLKQIEEQAAEIDVVVAELVKSKTYLVAQINILKG